MNAFRMESGGRIDRSKPVGFTFDGEQLTGFAGDTLASALLANGIHLVGRSFKYHRPRGILSAGAEEPNALVTVDRGGGRETPNLRATQVEIYDGLRAMSQNRWPSLRFDVGATADLLSPLLSAGFYYKTFMWPRSFWSRLYEPAIRASAGLGRAPKEVDPDRYLQRNAHCDVLVVGAGPAGLAAAFAAAERGARVILSDEQTEPGGSLLHETRATIGGRPATAWMDEAVASLQRRDAVTLLRRTTAFGYFAENFLGLVERVNDHLADSDPRRPRERLWQVRAKEVVLATGALPRPIVFPDNDRPGVMLAEAARVYLNRYGVRAGSRAVIATADDGGYRTALDLREAGVTVAAVVDMRHALDREDIAAARSAGIPIHAASVVRATRGRLRIESALIGKAGDGASATEKVACDLLLMSGGWTPSIHLFSQSRGKVRFDEALQAFVPGQSVQRERSAGACRGTYALAACVEEGYEAGEGAAKGSRQAGHGAPLPPKSGLPDFGTLNAQHGQARVGWERASRLSERVPDSKISAQRSQASLGAKGEGDGGATSGEKWPPHPLSLGSPGADARESEAYETARQEKEPSPTQHGPARVEQQRWPTSATADVGRGEGAYDAPPSHGKAFVDFQNDVTVDDLTLATREGFRSIEHVKRYTTTGMATDQGKTSNMNTLAIVANTLDRPIPAVGLTTFRMPYTPVTFGALAGAARGELFDPVRKTPIHDWATEQGAVFEDVGLWKRARYFPRPGEAMRAAVARECRAVRNAVGIFDATTLGKIEVVGPDAAEFMNRMYTNAWTKLEPGRCRYGLLLTEAGFVMDDGIVGRLAPDRFHVTTTTGGAPRVLHHMEDYLQTEFTDLKVWLTSVTEQWAVIAVQGPKAREVIAPLIEGVDLSAEAMPHMSIREGRILGVPMRLFRVSFTGELGFEINVPAEEGRRIWEAVIEAGKPHGITPYGTETMHVLRAEKGYIIVGQETDGTVTPDDLGLGWAVGKSKPDFVGKRSLGRPDMLKEDRKQLIGLLTQDPNEVLEEGAQIVAAPETPIPARMLGHVTSSYWSEMLGRSIALALVSGGRARVGTKLFIAMPGRDIEAWVFDPVFFDREGARLNG